MKEKRFLTEIRSYYRAHGRSMPWRDRPTLYNVVVSEIMLQQTQVSRVMVKFASFTKRFPGWQALAQASTREVLQEWSGLGYNRRALYMKRIAEIISARNGRPSEIVENCLSVTKWSEFRRLSKEDVRSLREGLRELPGIGPNTAGSILAFAFNIPVPFIETNIRSVFIHFFFPKAEKVSDSELMPLIEKVLADPKNRRNPREWYYALMDYGAHLKRELPNPSRRSAHHVRQSPFKGSNRELRARILREIIRRPQSAASLRKRLASQPSDALGAMTSNLSALAKEGFIEERAGTYRIA